MTKRYYQVQHETIKKQNIETISGEFVEKVPDLKKWSILWIMAATAFFLTALLLLWSYLNGFLPGMGRRNRQHLFGATYMTMNNPFYEIMDDEIRSVIEARGDRLITRDPALDVEKQIAQIQEMIDQKVDAIFINPVDWKALGPVLREAEKAEIPIIVMDSDVFEADLASCTVLSNNYQAGIQCARHLLQEREQGQILLLTHGAAKSGIDRIQGFKDTIEGHEAFHILAEEDCLGQLELAMPATEKLLREYPQADVIMCLNDLAAMGAMAALKEEGRIGQLAVYGIDGSPDGKTMIKEGFMEATAAQFPRLIGRKGAEAAYQVLEGKPIETVIKIDTELITKENIEQYGTDGWQ